MDDGNESYLEPEEDRSAEHIALMTCIFVVITIVGVIGNGLILLTVLLNSSMRTAPNVLLTNLAIGDLLILTFWLPDQYVKTLDGHSESITHSSRFMCIAVESCQVISQSVSALTLTVLSLDRYFVITSTTGRSVSSLLKFYFAVVCFIWLVGLGFASPIIYFAKFERFLDIINDNSSLAYEEYMDTYVCQRMPLWTVSIRVYELCRATLLYVIPVLIIGTSYSLMARKLLGSLHNVRRLSSRTSSRSQQTRTRKRLAIAVLVIAILFAICWLPEMAISILRSIDTVYVYNIPTELTQDWAPLFVYINCCANPIALGLTSLTFRRYFKRYLLFEFVRSIRTDDSTGTEYRYISLTNRLQAVNKQNRTESIESTEVDKT
ncbi:bombesin receptor subtype-3-like [Anneissia japonica]|uniref:bombesin receptor subtype-3-like n=1 Tax=Anneissia japonica TaxID=1529436 RepID=UPI00142571CB|nr:bombesin receptor subtype-3-like [Anneissia japonica]